MKQQTSQITFKTDVGNVSFIDSHYFAKTYKNDFNRNSFFLPSAGEALADIYDEEIVPFYDSEMVYQCDKIWPKKIEDYADVSFFIYTYTQDNLMITSWVSRGGGQGGGALAHPQSPIANP